MIRDIFSIIGKGNNQDYSYNLLLSDEHSKSINLKNVSISNSNLLPNQKILFAAESRITMTGVKISNINQSNNLNYDTKYMKMGMFFLQ